MQLLAAEVKQAEKRGALALEEAVLAERKSRAVALEEMRVQLGALGQAHSIRVQQQVGATRVIACGAMGVVLWRGVGTALRFQHQGAAACGAMAVVLWRGGGTAY